ncbi:MAG: HEAT repeat domain-containing protein [Elusimicrobia bacterium]|nr:HEAT repeat domain-containing protein [Elusimicrobiota bacterium]
MMIYSRKSFLIPYLAISQFAATIVPILAEKTADRDNEQTEQAQILIVPQIPRWEVPLDLIPPSADLKPPKVDIVAPSVDLKPKAASLRAPEPDLEAPSSLKDMMTAPTADNARRDIKKELPGQPPAPKPTINEELWSKKRLLDALAQSTGGAMEDLLPGEDPLELIQARLIGAQTISRDIQAVFLIDNSQAPENDPALTARIVGPIKNALTRISFRGEVFHEFRYYVEPDVFGPNDTNPAHRSWTPDGENDSVQYHWEEINKSISKTFWFPLELADVERVIFLVTEENGRMGRLRFDLNDMIHQAAAGRIRFEALRLLGKAHPMHHFYFPYIASIELKPMELARAQKILSYPFAWKLRFNRQKRMLAASRLGHTGSPRYIDRLGKALSPAVEQNAEVRLRAAVALAEIDDARRLPFLIDATDAFKEPAPQVRLVAVSILGRLRDASMIKWIAQAADPLWEPNQQVRRQAVLCLADFNGLEADDYLEKSLDLKEPDEDIRRLAGDLLAARKTP